jgi:hypothetical protein
MYEPQADHKRRILANANQAFIAAFFYFGYNIGTTFLENADFTGVSVFLL